LAANPQLSLQKLLWRRGAEPSVRVGLLSC
jgi:hypothetical protein